MIDYDELHTGKRREAQYLHCGDSCRNSSDRVRRYACAVAWQGRRSLPQSEILLAIRAIFALTPATFSIAAFCTRGAFRSTPGPSKRSSTALLRTVAVNRRSILDGTYLAPAGSRDVDEETGWFLVIFARRTAARWWRGAHVLGDVLRVALLALAITVGLALWVKADLEATGGNAGPLAVFAIVIAGFALTVFVFHLSRIGPALRFRRAGISAATIDAHLVHGNGERGTGVLAEPVPV